MSGAAFAGRYAAHDFGAVFGSACCMKSAFFAGDALNNQPRVVINEYSHERQLLASSF